MPSVLSELRAGVAQPRIRFAILSDLHYRWGDAITASYIVSLNALRPPPDFVVVTGDIVDDSFGMNRITGVRDYAAFRVVWSRYEQYIFQLTAPVKPVLGNHDFFFPRVPFDSMLRLYRQDPRFTYDFETHLAHASAGLHRGLYYSWDLNGWHFIAVPCAWSDEFLTAIGFFDWFQREMTAHRGQPTMIFTHVPVLPVGIGGADHYFTTIRQKAFLRDQILQHGAVSAVFSGHIHFGTKISIETARSYRETDYITVPQHTSGERSFGQDRYLPEEVATGSHGILVVDIDAMNRVSMYSIFPNGAAVAYPSTFPAFWPSHSPITFTPLARLPAVPNNNLSFENGFSGWFRSYEFVERTNPTILRSIASDRTTDGVKAAHLRVAGRYRPGQDLQPNPHGAVYYTMLTRSGNLSSVTVTGDCFLRDLQWRTRPNGWYYTFGFLGAVFFNGERPVFEVAGRVGHWGHSSQEPLRFDGPFNGTSIFVPGEYHRAPAKAYRDYAPSVGAWRTIRLPLSTLGAPSTQFTKVLLCFGVLCDDWPGQVIEAYFDRLRISHTN
jgi:hypothetical protein